MRTEISGSSQPRVCLVAPFPPPYGGIARWTQIITAQARKSGLVDLHLIDIAPRWRDIHDLRPWRRWLVGSLHGVGLISKVAWRLTHGCRALHITTSGQLAIYRDIAMLRLAKFFGVPTIYHLRFGRIPELIETSTPEWQRLAKALHLATTIISIDQQTEVSLKNRLPNLDIRLIPNCVNVNALPTPINRPTAPLTVLFLGWVIPAKGIEELLQAWADLGVMGWRLVIAGPCEAAYQQELVSRYPQQFVNFVGPLSHTESMKLMANSDIFVLPSHTEGFPNVVVEAMALGKPILATAVGAIPEMLEGGCGKIVPAQDTQKLKAALGALMMDSVLRTHLGEAALKRVNEHYTLEAVFARLVALWKEHAG